MQMIVVQVVLALASIAVGWLILRQMGPTLRQGRSQAWEGATAWTYVRFVILACLWTAVFGGMWWIADRVNPVLGRIAMLGMLALGASQLRNKQR